ncbi:mycophenolic acid acyl-glucuronide esterase, mitochondrial isoform X2 [Vombatus ursinus]|uniref:mycophenolic acid acyl-glucuronide esterase, mitochondrial isoform X2 n=1 Tax=Vombatus ursinus TaxID=29139 RepID=UPI000FFDAACE|nr:mycophenolic acid acyl-glucuronide esterase, mitochondrial isoform X2 [Vombatus ursinus]
MAGGWSLVSAAALVRRKSWDFAAISFGPTALLSRRIERTPRRLPVCRWKTNLSFLSRPDLPNLAYKKLKGKTPGVIFIPGYLSNMNGTKAMAIEEFCKSLGHAYIRFDYSGCGSSEGKFEDCTVGKWRKDVLSIIDDIAEGPQILVGSSMGAWLMLHAAIARPQKVAALVGIATAADSMVTQFNQLSVEYSFIKEASFHCLLHGPIPVTCPVRLLHGMKDEFIPWQTSMQIADHIISSDIDVILRKNGDHRMKEKEDIKLLVYTIDDLIDKLTTSN